MNARHVLCGIVVTVSLVAADAPRAQDSLRLAALQANALKRDPRARAFDLLLEQSRLRQQNIDTERRPVLSAEGQAQYQSDVTRFPISLPGGVSIPTPPHDTYNAYLNAQQRLFDATRTPRRAVERAQAAEAESRLQVSLQQLRQAVSDAFFSALRFASQRDELANSLADLDAQLASTTSRVREGTALPGEELAIRAEILRRRQTIDEFNSRQRTSLGVLASLTGVAIDTTSTLALPNLATTVANTRSSINNVQERAEYQQFARARDVLSRQEDARLALDKPRLSAFGRAGYGRPGLNPLNDSFDTYWLMGLQVQWTPWNWRSTDREREVLSLERQVINTNEKAFTETLRRNALDDLATIDRLVAALVVDDEIVVLRERIATETRLRFNEGVITSAEFVDRETDVVSARTVRALHRVELAQARAHFLTMLGIEVQ